MIAHDRQPSALLRPFDADAWSKRSRLAAGGADQLSRRKHFFGEPRQPLVPRDAPG